MKTSHFYVDKNSNREYPCKITGRIGINNKDCVDYIEIIKEENFSSSRPNWVPIENVYEIREKQ